MKNNNNDLIRVLGKTINKYYVSDFLVFLEEKKQKTEEDITIEETAQLTEVSYARVQLISKVMADVGLIDKRRNETGMEKYLIITPYGRRIARWLLSCPIK